MQRKKQQRPPGKASHQNVKVIPKESATKVSKQSADSFPWLWLLGIAGITIICFWPMLGNDFTNWDDDFYVVNNILLRGPDWKGIFTQPVAANYHPLTMISLALNYQMSGLQPFSYLFTDMALHVLNTTLVFYFVWLLSGKKIWVSAFCALVFAIHPMHVESVAWISERKDLLYTLFFMLSLIAYQRFLQSGKGLLYALSFLFAILSLLSKPAAVILPLVLVLMDFYGRRKLSQKLILEKVPFFVAALALGILTLKFQSTAMAGLEVHSVSTRLLFACYSSMTYFIKFFIPVHLSAFYPFPSTLHPGWIVFVSPLFVIAVALLLWYFRKDKVIVFGILFFVINILLVVQLISVGQTIVSERYTYVAYLGLAFAAAMKIEKAAKKNATVQWSLLFVLTAVFGILSHQRSQVWKNSGTLWSDVINQFPASTIPRTNRANYYLEKANGITDPSEANVFYLKALDDCNAALAADPKHFIAHNDRGRIYIKLGKNSEALDDGNAMIHLDPADAKGYAVRGKAYTGQGNPGAAIADFNKGLELDPKDYNMLYDRGALYFNTYNKYREALADFDRAIALHPQGLYFMTQSFCYYRLGDLSKAKETAAAAMRMGAALPPDYLKLLGM